MFKIYQLEVISWKLIVHIMRCDIFNWLQFLLTLISLLKVFNVKMFMFILMFKESFPRFFSKKCFPFSKSIEKSIYKNYYKGIFWEFH